jgi:putative zinc finger/helix-turn-helix YgiT family protein
MFNYICEECGKGTVREKTFRDYPTKIKGYPFVVDEARIGICDQCQAKHFNAKETKRWDDLYNQQLRNKNAFLSASDISEVRESLSLSIEGLAYLIGCTRQSIYNWERPDREKPQSRMADLLIKLVRDSAIFGDINVIDYLVEQAKQQGIDINLTRMPIGANVIRLTTKSVVEEYLKQASQGEVRQKLAAATDREKSVMVAESSNRDFIGLLRFDYQEANMLLKIIKDTIGLQAVDVTVVTGDGQKCSRRDVKIKDETILLLSETGILERDIKEIILQPKEVNRQGL